MPFQAKLIESDSLDWPEALRHGMQRDHGTRIWAIGNLAILEKPLLAFFCSHKCPGDVILRTYDVVRALRDAGIIVVGGFHSPLEKDCLELLLRGHQPIVICPARSIENMRIPAAWRETLTDGRLLILSPFEPKQRRMTAELAEQRNGFVSLLAGNIFVAHAAPESRTERFFAGLIRQGRRVYTHDFVLNERMMQLGVVAISPERLVASVPLPRNAPPA